MLSRKIYLFVLSREIVNVNNDIAWKYGNVTIKDFRNKKKTRVQKEQTELRHPLSQQLETTSWVSKFSYL